MSKSKFISTSATVVIITSVVLGANGDKALANPFSTLWQKFKTAGRSLTIVNPFKTSGSGSSKLNKPNSKASSSLYSRLKNFFTKDSKKSYNITSEDNTNANTTIHTLKGDDNKPASKSKQKRERLAAAYDNDTESLTSGEGSSDDSNNISSIKQPESKNKPNSNNPSVSFADLTISSEDSSSNSETNAKSNKNSDLVSDLKSELQIRIILMNDELNHKSLLEKNINRSNDTNVKKALYSHLGTSNKKISDLEGEIKNIQQLIKSLQN